MDFPIKNGVFPMFKRLPGRINNHVSTGPKPLDDHHGLPIQMAIRPGDFLVGLSQCHTFLPPMTSWDFCKFIPQKLVVTGGW